EICPGDDIAVFVEVESPGVAAAFREQLELARDRMVAPDALLKLDAANVGRHSAPLRAVEPAVRPPGQRVCQRMRVFEAEAAEQYFRIAVGNIVVIAIRIEKQVGRLNHKDTA